MYSWMRPEQCETKEELNISKALFQAYVQKEVNDHVFLPFMRVFLFIYVFPNIDYFQVAPLIGDSDAADLLKIFHANVQVHETFFVY
jgi:hypothetical protein